MLTVDLTSNTASGVAGCSTEPGGTSVEAQERRRPAGTEQKQEPLTCLQVPQVVAAHLVVPALAESVAAAPDVEP